MLLDNQSRLDFNMKLKVVHKMVHWNFLSAHIQIHARRLSLSVVLAVLLLSCVSVSLACPSICSCDRVVIECSGKGIQALPVVTTISQSTVVNISINNLTFLQKVGNNLPSHSILDLSSNQIAQVSHDFFCSRVVLWAEFIKLFW